LSNFRRNFHGRRLIAPGLYQDVQHLPVLIDRTPEVVLCAVDGDEHFVQVPRVARLRSAAAQGVRIGLAELAAPLADGLVRQDDAPLSEQFLHVAVAEGEAEIPPDGVADDLRREPVALVTGDPHQFIHGPSIAQDGPRAGLPLP